MLSNTEETDLTSILCLENGTKKKSKDTDFEWQKLMDLKIPNSMKGSLLEVKSME